MRGISNYVATTLGIESDGGVTAIEYGLIAGLIAVAVISAITLIGTNLSSMFNYIAGQIQVPGA